MEINFSFSQLSEFGEVLLEDWQVTEPRGCIYGHMLERPMTELNTKITFARAYSRGHLLASQL